MEPDFNALYLMALNGGAPLTDWQEVSEWAQYICKPIEGKGR